MSPLNSILTAVADQPLGTFITTRGWVLLRVKYEGKDVWIESRALSGHEIPIWDRYVAQTLMSLQESGSPWAFS